MNIFKVLASAPRTKFPENQVSAFLACLLNPSMDHGLGFEFLTIFLKRIGFKDSIIKKLRLTMSDKNNDIDIRINLECPIDGAIIDILLKIEDYYISIENKIYSFSASDKEQLKKQYQGLQIKKEELKPKSITMVFIVPKKDNKSIKDEFDNLIVNNTDDKKIISWKEISEDIQNILEMERNCEISPIDEYSRNTLKAFSVFINNDFEGYIYKEIDTYDRKSIDEILTDESITYIGVQLGEAGLKKLDLKKLKEIDFKCTTGYCPNDFWIKRDKFLDIVNKTKNKENQK